MINLANSLVESYMYADMYNREYEGGSGLQEKVYGAGVPVEYILPSIQNEPEKADKPQSELQQEGGQKCKGPFANKVVPVGLVFIQTQKDPDVEYEDHFYPGVNREVVPDDLYEILIGSVLKSSKIENTPANKKRVTPTKKRTVKERSRKKK